MYTLYIYIHTIYTLYIHILYIFYIYICNHTVYIYIIYVTILYIYIYIYHIYIYIQTIYIYVYIQYNTIDTEHVKFGPLCDCAAVLPGPRPLPRAVRPGALPGLAVEDLEQNVDV